MKLDKEKKLLLDDIQNSILEKYRKSNVPMIFKTSDCEENEWIGKNLETNELKKLKFIPNDGGTKIIEVENGSELKLEH